MWSAVEREFGRLKHHFGLASVRVRGIERVRLHADLIMLARLARGSGVRAGSGGVTTGFYYDRAVEKGCRFRNRADHA
jgi:hypothetical protein